MSLLGFNTGYVEELYRQYLENPESVSESWRDFFADYHPDESFVAVPEVRLAPAEVATPAVPAQAPQPSGGDGSLQEPTAPPLDEDVELKPLRGPAAKIVENMEASLGVPTATSVRTLPVKLLSENRRLINDYQRNVGGEKVSFTHIIAFAVVQALRVHANMNTTLRHDDGTFQHVIPKSVNFGLAIDIERRGRRTLLVPNIKKADEMNFAQFLGAYNNLIRRARQNELDIADFQGTTASLTNPGMIGTSLSVPRLMQGQGVIVGIGSVGYPPEYHALPPEVISKAGLSEVMSITSTYDHRVIQGAESGAFLSYISELILGEHEFYHKIFADLNIPYAPFTLSKDTTPQLHAKGDGELDMIQKQARVLMLIRVFRVRGHLLADTNPLGSARRYHAELDPAYYGLTIWDLDRVFVTGGLGGKDMLPLREILEILRRTYTHRVGIAFMHITSVEEKDWLMERIETTREADALTVEEKRRILQKLNSAEAFERFLHTKYTGHKRFSLEGADSVIPMLDTIISDAADQEVHEIVIGMAHRGRLNVLANVLQKPYNAIFSEFEGDIDPNTIYGSGDVKYHLGSKGEHIAPSGATINLRLASNPSHLEAVNPIVEGMVRAKQDLLRRSDDPSAPGGDVHDAVIPILLHGDAAFAGQGVVAETLNFSQLRGYHTGGTIHIVINNQIGFTTGPSEARSSIYATDIARMIEVPVFHVNGDDPEACIRMARLALDYRQVFNKDVVIDLLCYRVHGHNEGDEPSYTNPLLYSKIEKKRSPRKLYTEALLRRGEMKPEEAEKMLDDFHQQLQEAFEKTKDLKEKDPEATLKQHLTRVKQGETMLPEVETKISAETLEAVVQALMRWPETFQVHPKLVRQFKRREELLQENQKIDWAFAEALAFGALLSEGTHVRLSGQDSRRATFSQRHAVLYDQETGDEYIPLNHIQENQGKLHIYDSLLSEYAVCGFEYGYSVSDPSSLVMWEAQFGDFSNGAQIIFDQFLSAAEEKWGQRSSLVILLPHGYEGQGPEHSSARLERFLQLCAENNMIVCNLSTPANYFHALRRQVAQEVKKPLILMTPKSLLRHPQVISSPEDLSQGQFQPLIPSEVDPAQARRLVFCSGKIYYDLLKALEGDEARQQQLAIARLEQIYPFPEAAIKAELERYRGVGDVFWMQEEPANMGAWTFLRYRFDGLLEDVYGDCQHRVRYAGRAVSASTATGSARVHELEQQQILDTVLDF